MKGKISILNYPFAPILDKFIGESFINTPENNEKGSPMTYCLTIVFEDGMTYVKAANSVWYNIDMKTGCVRMKKYEGSKKSNGLFVYMREEGWKNVGILKEASRL